MIRHVFVYVVRRRGDPFAGLKQALSSAPEGHAWSEVRLSDANYQAVHRTEYSSLRKNLRFLYYGDVFAELSATLQDAVHGCTREQPCFVYFSDEGVWAAFFLRFKSSYPPGSIIGVNVQHGFEYQIRSSHAHVRRTANAISWQLLGFPVFGLGSFGGIGGGAFDAYLTYDDATAAFIQQRTGDIAVSCPSFIKHDLWVQYHAAIRAHDHGRGRRILFALQPSIRGLKQHPQITGTVGDMLDAITPLARAVQEIVGTRLILRIHPGMNRADVEREVGGSGIASYAELDTVNELASSLARCQMVISFDSTVLWEASFLGLLPVSYQCRCFKGKLNFPHEVLFEQQDIRDQMRHLLTAPVVNKYRGLSNHNFKWMTVVDRLLARNAYDDESLSPPRTEIVGQSTISDV